MNRFLDLARINVDDTNIQQLETLPMLKRLFILLLLCVFIIDAHAQDCTPSTATSGTATSGTSTSSAASQYCQPIDPSTPPTVSLTYAPDKSMLVAPGYIALVVSAEAYGGATVVSISYYNGQTLLATLPIENQFVWRNVPAGTYTLTAVANDSNSLSGNPSAPVTIRMAGNVVPTVTLTATLTAPNAPGTIALSAVASDSDGSISKVEFFNGTALLATKTQAPYSYTWSNVAAGSYSLTARATDNLGAVTSTQPTAVTVGIGSGDTQIYYLYADQVNTALEITNAAGAVVWRGDASEPFGANAPNENPSGFGIFSYNPRFPGQYYDKETNLHYNYYRDYDPSLGRYVESDPIGLRGGVNTFAYVRNSPMILRDSFGLDVEVGVRLFSPVPLRYVRHCFVRFNGNNNDTLSFDNQGVHADPNPTGTSWLNHESTVFSKTDGVENDSCVREEMNKCHGEDYDFTKFNCCMCASNALNACGLKKQGEWPNWPKDASNPPYVPPVKK